MNDKNKVIKAKLDITNTKQCK